MNNSFRFLRTLIEAQSRAIGAPSPVEVSEVAQLRRENTALAQRVANLERRLTKLRVDVQGGTVKELQAAGIAVRGVPATAKVKPLHEVILNAVAHGLGLRLKELDQRFEALEQRPALTIAAFGKAAAGIRLCRSSAARDRCGVVSLKLPTFPVLVLRRGSCV